MFNSFYRPTLMSWLFLAAAISVVACESSDAQPEKTVKAVPVDPSQGSGGAVGDLIESNLRVGLRTREFRLVVPKTIDPKVPAPLIFSFHASGSTARRMANYTQLDKLARKENFILVYPQGSKKQWRITPESAENDLEFFDELYDRITAEYNIDRNRVFAVGHSNGAFFVHLLAAERSDRVAAIVSHSGGIGLVALRKPDFPRKYAVMIVHGTADENVHLKTARETRDIYQKWGHAVEYLELPDRGHDWALKDDVDEKLWKFLMDHPLKAK